MGIAILLMDIWIHVFSQLQKNFNPNPLKIASPLFSSFVLASTLIRCIFDFLIPSFLYFTFGHNLSFYSSVPQSRQFVEIQLLAHKFSLQLSLI